LDFFIKIPSDQILLALFPTKVFSLVPAQCSEDGKSFSALLFGRICQGIVPPKDIEKEKLPLRGIELFYLHNILCCTHIYNNN